MSSIKCEIESKSDFLTGMYLTVRIPDGDVDENALLTIQEDCPSFILPFNYKSVNGQTEFTYKVGSLSKLQYFYGEVSHAEYVSLWSGLLSPLFECRDWFMNSRCFVLSAEYLYYDKNKKTVAYVYIPAVSGCSGGEAFNEMAIEVAKSIKVSDPVLENKVLRSIINDFNPNEFLKMLLKHTEQKTAEIPKEPVLAEEHSEAISEDIPTTFDISPEKVSEAQTEYSSEKKKTRESKGIKIFSSGKKKNGEAKRNGYKNTIPNTLYVPPVTPPFAPPYAKSVEESDCTQETRAIMSGTGLRSVGRAHLPQLIEVDITEGGIFTVGRHDVNVGRKQSNFEFDVKTKAVSRRHAAIERDGQTYKIVDLSSSAGTFVDDRKLPPNTPTQLTAGCRVSFGNMGADYVWENS